MTTGQRFFPIIYVRGYALTRGDIDDAAADPFAGFNSGSTVLRATPDRNRPPRKFIFESPVVRLASDFDYRDVYEEGVDIVDPEWSRPIPPRSIVIYRYYESSSMLLGDGRRRDIEEFARGLSDLILRVRALALEHDNTPFTKSNFRCYLVSHSMGGLVCRAFLQNSKLGTAEARRCVDKVFTYATPHNGLEFAGINVPEWLGFNDVNNFNRKRMAEYLSVQSVYRKTKRVDWIPDRIFPASRFFCMVGTNRSDYDVAAGVSRTFAGHGSDGLVKVDNASVWGVDEKGEFTQPSATAYAYRSHSGYFGLVNSEESYQNLVRFLFGDVRVDIWVDIEEVSLPQELAAQEKRGRDVDGLYQFEVLASPRGKRWFLTRRTSEEDSVACRSHRDIAKSRSRIARHVFLSTVFLTSQGPRPDLSDNTFAYSLTLGVRAPDYEVDGRFWPDRHFEGGYLFRDSIVVEMAPGKAAKDWRITYDWQRDRVGEATTPLSFTRLKGGAIELKVPFASPEFGTGVPGIRGQLRFVAATWNG